MTLNAALLWIPLFVWTPPESPLRVLGRTLNFDMLSGWPNFPGFDMSRIALPPAPRPAPISHCQVWILGFEKLAMMVPKMSEYDSFSAPDWFMYASFEVESVTPWNISWPTTSRSIDIESV